MRILHTSDWHLGKSLESINRLDEQRQFVDELCDIADKENVELVLIAGDIFDTSNPSSAAEELYYNALDRLNSGGRRAVVVIAGNHDNPERLCAAAPLANKNGIFLLGFPVSDASIYDAPGGGVRLVDGGPGWIELGINGCDHKAAILTLPFPSESRLEQVLSIDVGEASLQKAYSDRIGELLAQLSRQHFKDDTVNLIISHIFLKGGNTSESERTFQVGGALTVDPEVLPGNAHYIALGHLHRPQKVNGSPSPCYYSGSPLAYSFSETGYAKVVYLIDARPGCEADIRSIILDSGRPLVKWIAKGGIDEALRWCEEGRDAGAWIDLEIHTDRVLTGEEQKQLRELNPGIINIRPCINTSKQDDYVFEDRENKKIDELFKEYYRHKVGVDVSEELAGEFIDVLYGNDEIALYGSDDMTLYGRDDMTIYDNDEMTIYDNDDMTIYRKEKTAGSSAEDGSLFAVSGGDGVEAKIS